MKPFTPADFSQVEYPVFTLFIRYKGIWDMQDLYETLADFFRNQKFKFQEVIYKHKRPSPWGYERQYVFQAVRNIEEYYQWIVFLFIHTYEANDIEVTMKDGTKKIFTKGRIWIQERGRLNMDFEKKFEENTFYAQLRNFYHKYIIQKKIEGIWWDEFYYKVLNRLHHTIQGRLKLETEEYEAHIAGVH